MNYWDKLPVIRLTNVLQDIPIEPNTLIVGYRRCGKTTKLLELAKKTNSYIIAPYSTQAQCINQIANGIVAYSSASGKDLILDIVNRSEYILIDEITFCSNSIWDVIRYCKKPIIATTSLLDLNYISAAQRQWIKHILIMTTGPTLNG